MAKRKTRTSTAVIDDELGGDFLYPVLPMEPVENLDLMPTPSHQASLNDIIDQDVTILTHAINALGRTWTATIEPDERIRLALATGKLLEMRRKALLMPHEHRYIADKDAGLPDSPIGLEPERTPAARFVDDDDEPPYAN